MRRPTSITPDKVEPAAARGPLVSVVVPTRNSARTIEACLRSILDQRYARIELVVVDNDSTDGTWDIAQGLADAAIRGGPERSAQRNAGVARSGGEFVLWIDSDMILAPEVVRCAGLQDGVGHDGVHRHAEPGQHQQGERQSEMARQPQRHEGAPQGQPGRQRQPLSFGAHPERGDGERADRGTDAEAGGQRPVAARFGAQDVPGEDGENREQ